MKKNLKVALGLVFVLGWAGATLAADAAGSGQSSGSVPPGACPCAQAAPSCGGCRDSGRGCCDSGRASCDSGRGCCDSGHDCIDQGCGDQGCQGDAIIFGGEWHVLRPVVNDNRAFVLSTANAIGTVVANTQQNFQYKFESDPSLWVGYRTECGLGFQATWFHLDNNSNTNSITIPGTGTSTLTFPTPVGFATFFEFPGSAVPFTFNSDLKMDIWDFDVTQRVEICHLDLLVGGGIRYLHIGQDYTATAGVPRIPGVAGTPGTLTDSLSNRFDGGGPTIILDGLRRFGNSGFSLYGNARGGVLFGAKRESGTVVASSVVTSLILGLGGVQNGTATSDNETTIGFGEIELGVQWARRMGSVNPFVRLGFEGREYLGIGNAANAPTTSNSSAVGAYGLVTSAGIGW
jgi:hypothetical protein